MWSVRCAHSTSWHSVTSGQAAIRPDIFAPNGYEAKERELVASGKWELVSASTPEHLLPKGEPDILHQIRVYRILT